MHIPNVVILFSTVYAEIDEFGRFREDPSMQQNSGARSYQEHESQPPMAVELKEMEVNTTYENVELPFLKIQRK